MILEFILSDIPPALVVAGSKLLGSNPSSGFSGLVPWIGVGCM